MFAFAVQNFGISLEQIYKMTWSEFQIRLLGYNEAQKNKMLWERNLFYSVAVSIGNFKKTPTPQKWMPLPFEEKRNKVTADPKKLEEIMAREMAIFEKNKKK